MCRRTLCGKWDIDSRRAVEACKETLGKPFDLQILFGLRQACVVKPPSFRYKDPPEVLKLIALRKQCVDAEDRERLVGSIHEARKVAKNP